MFLVESYVPRLDEQTSTTISSRVRAAVRQLAAAGVAVRWLQSFALADEETYVCIIGARDDDDILELIERAALENVHLVEIMVIDPSTLAPG